MSIAEWTFGVSFLVCLYVYAGYPGLLAVLAHLRPRPVSRGEYWPSITVVIPAFNEEDSIADKIRGTLDNGYPEHLLETLVASDGSTDRTNEIVRGLEGPRVRLLALPRRGKLAALNAAVRDARGDIVVFTDADVNLDAGALSRLVSNFADQDVGGVTGRKAYLRQAGQSAIERGDGLYSRFDEWQKLLESRIGSTIGAHGALHAIRRDLYVTVHDTSVADDMAISMRVVLQGRRLVYEREAVARVERPVDGRTEFARRVRIANQVMRAMFGLGTALWTSGFYSVQLVSHKLLRYWAPVLLILMFVSNAALAMDSASWRTLLVLQSGFYGSALAALLLGERCRGTWLRVLTVPYYFCAVNAGALVALLSVARGRRSGTWAPGAGFREGAVTRRAWVHASRPASRTPAAS
jgi:cellulose synthase/poly-beta-1,6-N-acetylglucosamine synthase-like glycosyltransferase